MKIMVDFDGVIHSFVSGYTGVKPEDPPIRGAKEFIERCLSEGHEVVIFTSRARPDSRYQTDHLRCVRYWMTEYGFPNDIRITGCKEPADLYIDDRAYRFTGDFDAVWEFMNSDSIHPHHKNDVY